VRLHWKEGEGYVPNPFSNLKPTLLEVFMPRLTSIEKLSPTDREAIDQQIRDRCYGAIDSVLEWTIEKGYRISRSSLARYVMRLRLADASQGKHSALVALTQTPAKNTSGHVAQAHAIATELARLQTLQNALIEQLSLLGGATVNIPSA
jgi:Protein of unknown function (DUF3486)